MKKIGMMILIKSIIILIIWVNNDTIINKVENWINKEYNTDYDPNSADYFTLKLYINISLFVSLKNIKQKQSENVEENMYYFLSSYIALINFLKSKEIDLTHHQKIRIINCFCLCNTKNIDLMKRPCRLFYIKDNLVKKNSYKLALDFNKNIIKNLKEKSALTSAFLQLVILF